jgi:ATP-binding cassette, subfamily C (CFTR/MRP), member 1
VNGSLITAITGQTLPSLAAAYASVQRIHDFLLLPERELGVTDDAHSTNADSSKDLENDVEKSNRAATISMQCACFSWSSDSDAFLKDVTLELPGPGLNMCVGAVASVSVLPIAHRIMGANAVDSRVNLSSSLRS